MKVHLLTFVLLALSFPSHGELDEHDQKALKETQTLLKDREQRRNAINENQKTRDADQNVKNLFGGSEALTDEAYALAAEVLANVVKSADGDARKMQEMMTEFHRDPAAFAATWTPEQKAKLKALAEKLGKPNMAPRK